MKLLTNISLKASVLTILLTLTFLNLLSLVFNLFDFGELELWVLLPAALLSIAFFIIGYWLLNRLLLNPIKEMGNKAKAMAYGKYDQSITYVFNNELSLFSDALNNLFEKFRNTSLFVKELGKGNIAYEWKEAQEGALYKEDTFIQSLIDTRNTLRTNEQSNYERNWATEGIAKLEDVLRQHSSDLTELSNVVITFLIKYLKANQGAVFLLKEEENEQVLELTACYAYGRKKFLEKHIKPGQGLVGQVVLEKEKIYLTEIPQNYTHITSGLGEATPTAIIILPLKVEEKVVGVVEIASFNTFASFEQDFLEKAAQSIASSVMNANTNIRTSSLLKQSQQQTEELRAQEEEMRQNMEEMEATQEEMRRISAELEGQKEKLSHAMTIAKMANWEIDLQKEEFHVNNNFFGLLETTAANEGGYSVKVGQIVSQYFYVDAENVQNAIGQVVAKANPDYEEQLVHKALTKSGREIYLSVTLKGVLKNGQVTNLYGVCRDVTAEVNLEKERDGQVEEMQAQEEVLRQNLEEMQASQEEMRRIGAALEDEKKKLSHALTIAKMANWEIDLKAEEFHVNDNFFDLLETTAAEEGGYSVKVAQVVSKYFYVDADNVQKAIGEVVAKADPNYEGLLVHKALTKSGKEIYLSVTLKGLLNENDQVSSLYGVCRDVTSEVNLEKERDAQLEEMQAQEEELRQNLEEMEATQEEMRRIGAALEGQKEKLAHAMTIAKMANWEINLKAEEFYVNDNFYQLLETTVEEEGGYQVKVAQIVSKYFYVDAENVQKAIGQVVAKADPKHEELLVHKALTKSGREIYLSVVLKGLLDDKGQVTGLYGVCRDVTSEVKLEEERDAQLEEMQAQEEELRQNLEEMEAVQEDMSRVGHELASQQSKLSHALRIAKMANWEIDLKTEEFHVNDNFFQLLETTAEEEGGYQVKVDQIVSKYFYVDAENVQKAIGQVIAKADAEHEELLVHKALTKSGKEIYLSVVLKALLSDKGEVNGLYGVCQDVTKEKASKNVK